MFHGLNNNFLYSAYNIKVTFHDGLNEKPMFGTAFFVLNKKGQICLVTNRHMLDMKYKNNDANNQQDFRIVKITVTGKKGQTNPEEPPQEEKTYSLAGMFLGQQKPTFSSKYENDVASFNNVQVLRENDEEAKIDFFITYGLIANEKDINSKLSVCDFVAFPGFPEWHDKKENRPIFRTGTISSDPRTNYSYEELATGDCIAYEAFSYSGSSGSPVFAMQKGITTGDIVMQGARETLLIGINAGHLKNKKNGQIYTHSGISYFYKSSVILEVINS